MELFGRKISFIEIKTEYSKEIKVVLIVLIAIFIDKISNIFIKKILNAKLKDVPENKKTKFQTLISLFQQIKSTILWIIVFLIVLSIYHIKITAILTGFGLIGVIIGLASQALIADFIAGIGIFLDKLFYIGDRIKIGDIEGEVIDMTLRRTYIKDDQGYIHSFPNSQIKLVSKKE
jgi:small conductance mechanosensitive channel